MNTEQQDRAIRNAVELVSLRVEAKKLRAENAELREQLRIARMTEGRA